MLGFLALLALASAVAPRATAQGGSVFERLGLDRLRLSGLGASYGVVKPSQIEDTEVVGVQADYGEVAPHWRVLFGVSYWGSRYNDAVVRRFADSLLAAVDDPTGDATVELGRVRVSAIALTAEGHWSPRRGRPRVRPYLGGGFGAYALNAEGRAISGTFVEDALDTVSAGVAAMGGADVLLAPNLSLGMQARYDLLSGGRFATLRASLSYLFTRGRA
ncbi:MAG TPA: hypothetical protein VFS08_07310 [Gemmatimonadaceae bacterium]|nr:hypothetical protein [Gemmatimonadaceae bacterium]